MKQVGLAKQLAFSAALLACAALGWQNRETLAVVLTGSAGAQVSAQSGGRASAEVPVIVAEVGQQTDTLAFSAIGTGEALRSVRLRAPSSGRITGLALEPGKKFRQGDALMQLDDTDARLALSLAEVRLERARQERDRVLSLRESGNAAAARFETAETDFQIAEIELDQARADVADRVLLAPFDGYAGLTRLDVGDRVAEDAEITAFDDRSSIIVEFDVPEALLSRLEPGLEVTAQSPSAERQSFQGRITAIDSRVDAQTRTARVRVEIENPADALRPGASFVISVDLVGADYPAVSELALQFSRGSLTVWRVTEGTAETVEVRLVRRRAGLVLVDGPLNPGDRVVIEGTQRLRPGSAVRVLNDVAESNT